MKKAIGLVLCLLLVEAGQYLHAGVLPAVSDKKAIEYEYFPSRMHAFVFRNWTLVPEQRLAEVLNTTPRNVRRVARSMGLQARPEVNPLWLSSKGYITVLRRNWHLLPYDQLITLLDISEEELAWRLREEDFLYIKLGSLKPFCEPVEYCKPDRQTRIEARKIRKTVRDFMEGRPEMSPRFDLFKDVRQDLAVEESDGLRMVFSYNAEFGDPFLDEEQSSFSDELLQYLKGLGVNAVWVHSVLRMMVAPDGIFPGDDQYAVRLSNLNRLVQRASKYGIKVFLYVNEPRSMPEEWFDSPERKALAGVRENDYVTICTSHPETLDWLTRSFYKVFSSVPGLGGVFTITASENLTNCASHSHKDQCPICKDADYADIISGVNNAIAKGVKSAAPDARVIAWDWCWRDDSARGIINKLSKDCMLMSVSEWSIPIERGGVRSQIGEYSISTPGPGPRAEAHWRYAREAGLKTVAKVAVNNTWEFSAAPAIPAMALIAEHARNLAAEKVEDLMMSWSLGGYPSVNMAIFGTLLKNPELTLRDVAAKFYGENIADSVEEAWKLFSEGFAEFPYHVGSLYSAPHHMGPANPFYLTPTGYRASMVGLPYDDIKMWTTVYTPEVFSSQMDKIAAKFDEGVSVLECVREKATEDQLSILDTDIIRAKAVSAHFKSTSNQVVFTNARNVGDTASMRKAVEMEKEVTDRYMDCVLADPTLGYESSNHYFFVPQDLVEKILNLEYISSQLGE